MLLSANQETAKFGDNARVGREERDSDLCWAWRDEARWQLLGRWGKQEAARTKFATLGGLGLTQTRVSFILIGIPNSAPSPKISCTTPTLFLPFSQLKGLWYLPLVDIDNSASRSSQRRLLRFIEISRRQLLI